MQFDSILNFECSMFANAKAIAPSNVNLLQWLMSDRHLSMQQAVRAATSDDEKRKAKEAMPCITPSGVFSRRGKNYLLRHTGFIAVDIDLKDNRHLLNFNSLKSEVCKLPNVAYCGHSVSGEGYWLLIPIAYPEKHEQHFEFIRRFFLSKNIHIDKSCSDVARLRFYSFDADAYYNHAAKQLQTIYSHLPQRSSEYRRHAIKGDNKPVWIQYNECTKFIDVLEHHGWKVDKSTGSKTYFTRPGKRSGVSAEYDSNMNVLYVLLFLSCFYSTLGS